MALWGREGAASGSGLWRMSAAQLKAAQHGTSLHSAVQHGAVQSAACARRAAGHPTGRVLASLRRRPRHGRGCRGRGGRLLQAAALPVRAGEVPVLLPILASHALSGQPSCLLLCSLRWRRARGHGHEGVAAWRRGGVAAWGHGVRSAAEKDRKHRGEVVKWHMLARDGAGLQGEGSAGSAGRRRHGEAAGGGGGGGGDGPGRARGCAGRAPRPPRAEEPRAARLQRGRGGRGQGREA